VRIRTGHGPDDWRPEGPANGATGHAWGGALVVEGPPSNKKQAASRATSQRYRVAHADRIREYQTKYRAESRNG
jgi:hypothetical protein